MPDLSDTLSGLAAQLSAVGVRTVLDARDLNPPGCLVLAPVIRWTFGGRLVVDYRLLVVAPSQGTAQAMKTLSRLMDEISAALAGIVLTAAPTEWPAPGGGDPLPAYELSWQAKTT